MKEIFKSKIFWFSSIVLAMAFFLVGINYNRGYVGEVEILVLPKNETSARNIDQIMANIEEMPFSLNFYTQLLQRNENVDDVLSAVSLSQKKDALRSLYEISRVKNSAIAKVDVFGDNQLQAEVLSRGVAMQTAVSMSQYYDIRKDLEIRLLDAPTVFEEDKTGNPQIIAGSLLLGFVLTLIFFVIKQNYSNNFVPTLQSVMRENSGTVSAVANRSQQMEKAVIGQNVEAGKFEAENFFRQAASEEKIETAPKNSLFKHPALANSQIKKSFAPDNLPVGEEFILSNLKLIKEKEDEKRKDAIKCEDAINRVSTNGTPKTHEATEEEIKARLNKLLGGGK